MFFQKLGNALGDVGMLVAVMVLLPVMILVVGAPIVLFVRLLIAVAERF
jgi:hypothetical protein